MSVEEAEKLDMVLVCLPPYSPDLNPIEKRLEELWWKPLAEEEVLHPTPWKLRVVMVK